MASFIKGKLKAARDSLGKKDYKAAEEAAAQVLEYEPANYNANVFLGLACLELGNHSRSEQAYSKAIESSPEQALAWQGLSKFYERTNRWQEYATALRRLADLFAQQEDSLKCAETLQKYIEFQRSSGTREQVIKALGLLLPGSPLYAALSVLPEPDPTAPTSTTTYAVQDSIHNSLPTLEEIVSLIERDEEEKIKKEVERRRMRLGAGRPEKIKLDVGREVWDASTLPSLYNELLNHPNTSDDLRRSTESKLLRRKYQHLQSVPAVGANSSSKQKLLSEVDDLSKGAVLLNLPDELAWMFFIESRDAYHIEDYDFRTLRRFIGIFPNLPLTALLKGYFNYLRIPVCVDSAQGDGSPEPEPEPEPERSDSFSSVLDASADLSDCLLSHRILCQLYQLEDDYENVIRAAESGLELLTKAEASYGKRLQRVRMAFHVALGGGLAKLFPPKHHVRAMEILSDVLDQDAHNVPCLISSGCILQYSGQWSNAETVFKHVIGLDPDHDVKWEAREEWAWCIVKTGRLEEGITELKEVVQALDYGEGKGEQQARAWWRLGRALWESGDDGKEATYKHFITSLKRSSTFAPAFTSLGIYYAEVASPPDLDRSSKCFQKAFELDAREGEAARRLAEGFAEEREWDLVEVVARRTIEGEGGLEGGNIGKGETIGARYLPTNAWAWKAVGVVELNRHNYTAAIQPFQVALRADQDDFISWQRLGESYAKSGRHTAAIKALKKALELRPDDWMCQYLLGDVYRLLAEYPSAIQVFEGILKLHPDDICVLLSLADTHLTHARSQTAEGYHSRAEGSTVAAILVTLELLDGSPGFRRVAWKIAADAVFELSRSVSFHDVELVGNTLASLASLMSPLETNKLIQEVLDFPLLVESRSVNGYSALQVAVGAYHYRISLDGLDDASTATAWFDLGMALARFSTGTKDEGRSNSASNQAREYIQKALVIDPGNDAYWNVLGNLNFMENPKLSQHAYIKALECNTRNVMTWTNLGLLYLHHGDADIANEALYRAQTLDPDYVLAWVGQGLIATANGHHTESHALFAHAMSLSADVPEADLEFAKRAFERLTNSNISETPELLLPSFHALDRYCKQRPNDAAALHLFGLICERLNLTSQALELVSRTIVLLEHSYEETEDVGTEEQFAAANGTLGRLRLSTGDFAGAVEAFTSALSLISTDDDTLRTKTLQAHAQFGSGLGNFRLGELEDALGMFESALAQLPSEVVNVRGHVTILLAQTLWALGSDEARETARGQLLECISADPGNLMAMTTLLAMGILDSDDSLVAAALSEIQTMPVDKRVELDPGRIVSQLLVKHHLAQGRDNDALAEIQRAVHAQPLDIISRSALASLLLQQNKTTAAAAVIRGNENIPRGSLDDAIRISAISLAADTKLSRDSLKLAQKSVFLAPWNSANWRGLAYVRCAAATGS
ncbi:TPR-like protein [Gautieria morchelliformis]|nr:TPR-like protein [Gautieria morchelliformis]